jgi:hypothetical protein
MTEKFENKLKRYQSFCNNDFKKYAINSKLKMLKPKLINNLQRFKSKLKNSHLHQAIKKEVDL